MKIESVAERSCETLPLVFNCIDREEREVVRFGRARGSTVMESDPQGERLRGSFEDYYQEALAEANEWIDGLDEGRPLRSTDEALLRTRYLLAQGQTFGTQGEQVKCKVDHDAVQRPLAFREYPLVVLLYAFDSSGILFDTVYELDTGRRPMPNQKGDSVIIMCRYRHADDEDDEGVARFDGAHAQLVRNAMRCLSAELSDVTPPTVVHFAGYRASRPITCSYHRLQPEREWKTMDITGIWNDAFHATRIGI